MWKVQHEKLELSTTAGASLFGKPTQGPGHDGYPEVVAGVQDSVPGPEWRIDQDARVSHPNAISNQRAEELTIGNDHVSRNGSRRQRFIRQKDCSVLRPENHTRAGRNRSLRR